MIVTLQRCFSKKIHESGAENGRRFSWIYSVLPFNVAIGPIGTLVQLLILQLKGSVVDVGLAVTLFNLVSIPAAMIWGFVTDNFHRRKPIIVASYMATAMLILSFLFVKTINEISVLYALLSFVTAASTTPLNLLVMETERKNKWATTFARLSMTASLGQTLGLIISTFWSYLLPLYFLVVPLGVLSMLSAGLSAFMIKEPHVIFERHIMVMDRHSFLQRLQALPYIFFRIPKISDFRKIFRTMRFELARQHLLLYLSVFMFYLSSGLFNTSIVPSLQAKQISDMLILLAVALAMICQMMSFRYAGPYCERNPLIKVATRALVLRSICYGVIGASAYLLYGTLYLIPVLIFLPLGAGLAYSLYYTSSYVIIFNTLEDRHQGSSLGVFSALVGIAIMLGSLISGFMSFHLGFHVTFAFASIFLIVSAWLLLKVKPLVL